MTVRIPSIWKMQSETIQETAGKKKEEESARRGQREGEKKAKIALD